MAAENDLFELERQFWSEVADADFYRYVKQSGSWKLAVHQQTPIPQDV